MALIDTIESIKTHIEDAYGIAEEKQATIPDKKNLENLSDCISSIPSGSAKEYTGHVDAEGLRQIGWTEDEINGFQENGVDWNEELDDYYKLSPNDLLGEYNDTIRYISPSATNKTYIRIDSLIGFPSVVKTSSGTGFFQNDRNLKYVHSFKNSYNRAGDNLFSYCYNLKYIGELELSKTTTLSSAFMYCHNLKKIPFFDTSSVNSGASNMFSYCYKLEEIPDLNLNNVTSMNSMFTYCMSLKKLPNLGYASVKTFDQGFRWCYSLKYVPNLKLPVCTTMKYFFEYCYSLEEVIGIEAPLCTNALNMFSECRILKKVSGLILPSVTNAGNMFSTCYNMCELDLSDWDLTKVTTYTGIFSSVGIYSSPNDGAYAQGICYVYVKDEANQQWILNLSTSNRPASWSTNNVIIAGSEQDLRGVNN